MLKRRTLGILFLALAMGGVAAWWAGEWAQARLTPSPEAIGMPVVVAAVHIPFAKKIDPADVVVKRMPADFIPAGAFTRVEELDKKVAVGPIYPGEVVIKDKIAGYQTGSPLSAIVGLNKRAVTVRVNDVIGVAGFLLPGNYVDVVGSRKKSNREAQARTILQNMKVLAVDQTASTNKDDPVIVRAVTLEMTPEEAERLVKATSNGSVQLTLRNPLDTEVLAQAAPAPEKPRPRPVAVKSPKPPPVQEVTVIRGAKISTTVVDM